VVEKENQAYFNKQLSKIYEKFHFLKFLEFSKKLSGRPYYLQHHSDFRGRLYATSQLSPINIKYIRYVIDYGVYSDEILLEMEETMKKTRAFKIIKNYLSYTNNLYLKNRRPLISITILYLFIELAKTQKNKILKDKDFSINLKEFIEYGMGLFLKNKTRIKETDFIKELSYRKIIYHIEQLKEGNILSNFIILKDSTASVLQHLFKWLGPRNNLALKICNLAGEDI